MSIIKVDRVTSIEEALILEAAGVDVIGVNLGLDPRCPERGSVSPALGREIGRALNTAKLCVMLDPELIDVELALEPACTVNPHYFQVSLFSCASGGYWREWFEEIGLPVIFDAYNIYYEDEPSSIYRDLDLAISSGATLVQLDMLSNIPDPWRFLQEEAYKEPDELMQMEDLVRFTEKYPVLITMEVSPDETPAFRSAFPAAAGIFFRLPPGDISPVLDVISSLQLPGGSGAKVAPSGGG